MAKQLLFNQTPSSGGGMGDGVVLWENPNPDVNFGPTYINIENISAYDYISVKFRTLLTANDIVETFWKRSDFELMLSNTYGSTPFGMGVYPYGYARNVGFEQTTQQYYFTDCFVIGQATPRNDCVIPLQIIGY